MNITVGQIGLNLVLNTAPFKKSLSVMQSKSQDTADKISGCFKKAAATVAATVSAAAVARFGKSCVELGSDLAEVQNVVDVTFNKLSGAVNKWSKEAAASYGLSETMAKKYVGTFGSMAEAFGFTEQQAYDMSTTLTGLTGDVASFYNIDQDLAYTKLKSVFSGETETLKDLGIVMTQSALDQYALANGVGKTTAKMTEAEKVTLRYKFVQDQLKNATGDFARTQDSWANQTRILQLRFDSLKATIGQGLINAFNPVLKVINSLIGRVSDLADKFKAFTDQIFGNAGDGSAVSSDLADASNSAGDLASNADTTSTALNNVADKAEKAKRSIAGFDRLNVLSSNDTSASATDTPNTAASAATSSMGKSLGSALSNAVDGLAAKWDAKGKKVIDSMKNAFSGVKSAVIGIGDSWKRVWSNGTGEKVIGNIKKMLSNIFDIIGDISTAFQKAWNDNGKGDAVIQSIIDKFNSIIELINTIGDDFREVWNSGVGERILGNILTIIENCNNATKTFCDKIKEAWEKNDTGKKIWQDILGLVEDISTFLADMSAIRLEFLENLDLTPLAEAAEKLLGAFRDLAKAVTDKLKDAYKTVLLPLAKWTIEKAVPKLVEALAGAFELLGKFIKKIPISVMAGIAAAIGAIVAAYKGFKIAQQVKQWFGTLKTAFSTLKSAITSHPYATAIAAIVAAVSALVAGMKTYSNEKWENSSLGKSVKDTSKQIGEMGDLVQDMQNKVKEVNDTKLSMKADFETVDNLKKRLQEIIDDGAIDESEKGEYKTIVDLLSEKVDGFDTQWNDLTLEEIDGKIVIEDNIDEVSKKLDDLVTEWEIAQTKITLQNVYTDTSAEVHSSKAQIKSLESVNDNALNELTDYIYEATNLSKEEAKIYAKYLKEANGSKKLAENNLKKDIKSGKIYTNHFGGSDDSLLDTGDMVEGTWDYYWSFNDKVEELAGNAVEADHNLDAMKSNFEGLQNEGDKAYDLLSKLNSGTYTYSDLINAVSDDYMTQSQALALVKDDGITTWDELEKAADDSADGIEKTTVKMGSTFAQHTNDLEYMGTVGDLTADKAKRNCNSTTNEVTGKISTMVDRIKTALSPLTNIFHNIFGGIWDVIKGPINTVMSGIESFINGIINGVKNMPVIDTILSKFGWSIGDVGELRLPRFAKGAIVKAPTLAVVGDNAGANTGNPEVIAPLNKLKAMIGDTTQQSDSKELLNYLKRIYEMLVINRNNGGNNYEFVAKLQGSVLFDEIVKQNEMYKKSHSGQSAFA